MFLEIMRFVACLFSYVYIVCINIFIKNKNLANRREYFRTSCNGNRVTIFTIITENASSIFVICRKFKFVIGAGGGGGGWGIIL